ncbi:protein FAR1-RELATED SEQUENCE 4-like [Humulus lupulus]|uniref:protein FAR1-RELATED SEQUENCE 4-like n=1 Tax=Humulus lupulus TaxID=3486 RepID=UPI002B40241C|nr:protein FAR1-RELATED SEQUENCE 4-like [Humulus lupulus]
MERVSKGSLGYLDCLSTKDPYLYVEYKIDDQHRLGPIYWVDEDNRRGYMLFGEAIAFDSTYKTNKYNKPLVIIVSVNQHFETCVFGLALILDESEDAFFWLLRVFLYCMGNKKSKVVLTDGDDRIALAIRYFLPSSNHRICA